MSKDCNVESYADWWIIVKIPKPQRQKVESLIELWDLCKFVNLSAPLQGKIHAL